MTLKKHQTDLNKSFISISGPQHTYPQVTDEMKDHTYDYDKPHEIAREIKNKHFQDMADDYFEGFTTDGKVLDVTMEMFEDYAKMMNRDLTKEEKEKMLWEINHTNEAQGEH